MSSGKQKSRSRVKGEHDPIFHYVSGPGWLHSHGMDRHGLPELEARQVPAYLAPTVIDILGAICERMLTTRTRPPLNVGFQAINGMPIQLVKGEPLPGDEDHYVTERWLVQDVEPTCECCRAR